MASDAEPIANEMLDKLRADPRAVASEMEQFEKDCTHLSAQHARLVDLYDGQFVAVYQEQVRAHDLELKVILQRLQDQGVDSGHTAIRRVRRRRRTLIL